MPANVSIRWGIRKDLPAIMGIESRSFSHPWTDQQFDFCLRQRNVTLIVAENKVGVVGYAVYAFQPSHAELLNLAVHPGTRWQGIGRQLLRQIQGRLTVTRRRVVAVVSEGNLYGHLFFKACGWRATGVIRDAFPDCEKEIDGYRFEWSLDRALIGKSDEFACEGK